MNATPTPLAQLRSRVGTGPLGRWILATAVCWKAPYFQSIRPSFVRFDPGDVVVGLPKRRAVTNHLGTVHAIAMCNAAELAAGTLTDLSMLPSLRWIPVGMTVTYERLAKTDLEVQAKLDPAELTRVGDVVVPVTARDRSGTVVFTAQVKMRVSEKPARQGTA